MCKSSTSLGLIFIICKKSADAGLDNVRDLFPAMLLGFSVLDRQIFFFPRLLADFSS